MDRGVSEIVTVYQAYPSDDMPIVVWSIFITQSVIIIFTCANQHIDEENALRTRRLAPSAGLGCQSCVRHLARFNKIDIQTRAQMAADKEAVG